MSNERRSEEEKLALDNSICLLRLRSDGGLWRHKKIKTEYTVLFAALEESTCQPVVVYRPRGQSSPIWTRPLEEFLDRFEPVQPEDPIRSQT